MGVLDPNLPRAAPLVEPGMPRPVLDAFDGATLALVRRSRPGNLEVEGRYSALTVARETVGVETNRIQAFGLR